MFGCLSDLVNVVVAPVRVVASMTDTVVRPITKPLADSAKDILEALKINEKE